MTLDIINKISEDMFNERARVALEIQDVIFERDMLTALRSYFQESKKWYEKKLEHFCAENDKARAKGVSFLERKPIVKKIEALQGLIKKQEYLQTRPLKSYFHWAEQLDLDFIKKHGVGRFIALFGEMILI